MFFFTIQSNNNKINVDKLYKDYEKLLYKVAYDILEDRYLAEDVVNQTFCIVLENIHLIPVDEIYKTKAYIIAICKNEARNIRKSRIYLNKNADMICEVEDVYHKYNGDPLDIILNNQRFSSVVSNVKKLKDIYQQAVFMKYFVGLPNKVIAKDLRISEQTLRKRLERGRSTVVDETLNETE